MPRLVDNIMRTLTSRQDEEGAAAVEYALMIGLVTAVIAGAVARLGSKINHMFSATVAVLRSMHP